MSILQIRLGCISLGLIAFSLQALLFAHTDMLEPPAAALQAIPSSPAPTEDAAFPTPTAISYAGTSGSGHGIDGTFSGGARIAGAPFAINIAPNPPTPVSPADGATLAAGNVPLTVHVSDPEADPLQVKFYGRSFNTVPGSPFRIIALPDTQYYSVSYPATFTTQTQWIVNNRAGLNIAYVAHEGDIVNDADQNGQWVNANAAISILDGVPDLPYGLCIGNHDEYPSDNPDGTGYFNNWFPYTRYQSRPWYGGHSGTNNDNHYILFTAGGMDFIAIHMEYDTAAAALGWAGSLLQNYSNRRAIVVIHSIMSEHANWTPQGSATYNALKVYPNLFLMLGGHIAGEARRTDVYANNTVHSLLADYQGYPNGGDGWLRILELVPADNAINVKTYSPKLGQYATEADSQFTLFYNMGGSAYSELATLTGVPSGTDATYVWPNLDPCRTYQWYASASDGSSTAAGPMRTFQTVLATPAITLDPTSLDQTLRIKAPATPDSFTVTNTGIGTLDYSITSNAPWLTVSPTSGSLAAQTSEAIQVNYETVNVPVGNHTAALTVSSATAWNSPQTVGISLHVITVKPDFDADGDVDLSDYGHLQACLSGTYVQQTDPNCQDAKLNADEYVDRQDLNVFLGCMSGSGVPADPNCANSP